MRTLTGTMAVLGLTLALCGCGRGPAAGTAAWHDDHALPADTLTLPTAEFGTHGGRFVFGTTAGPRTFNVLMASEQSSSDIDQRLFAGLADFDNETQQNYPVLAKSWETSPDGLTWTWHLRRGARFSDGHPITSADVLFMFQLVYDGMLHPSLQDLLMAGGKPFEVSAPDSYTVVTKLAAPHAVVVAAIGALRIMPKHILEPIYRRGGFAAAYGVGTAPESLVTSGPFVLKQYVPGEKVVLGRNPWWIGVDARGQRLPYLDELVYTIVPDQNTAAIKFQAGELDAIDNVKPEDYHTYVEGAGRGGYTLHDLGPSLTASFMWFNLNRTKDAKPGHPAGEPVVGPVEYRWFSNRAFRRAVSKAIDRDALIRGPFYGQGFKNWSAPTLGSRQWGALGVTGYDYDPAGAKALLDSLGWKDTNGDGIREDDRGQSLRFTIKTNADNATRIQMLALIKDDLARAGIACTPVPVDFNTLTTNMRQDLQYDAILAGLGSAVPPDPAMYANFVTSHGGTHYWNVKQDHPATPAEAELDRLYREVAGTSDMTRRLPAWKRIVELINDECFVIWLPTQKIMLPVRNRFGNVHPTAVPHRVLWNIDRVFVKPSTARS